MEHSYGIDIKSASAAACSETPTDRREEPAIDSRSKGGDVDMFKVEKRQRLKVNDLLPQSVQSEDLHHIETFWLVLYPWYPLHPDVHLGSGSSVSCPLKRHHPAAIDDRQRSSLMVFKIEALAVRYMASYTAGSVPWLSRLP